MILPFILAMGSLFVVVDLLTSGGNAVAQAYRYCFFGAAVFGLLSPKNGFYVLLFLTAYLDFFKRLMILDSGVAMMDLYFVLGVAPALICGIAASVLYSLLTNSAYGPPGALKLALLVLAGLGLLAVVGMAATSGIRTAADIVNALIYLLLLFVVPVLFPTPESLRKMLGTLTLIYIPSVLYMLVHWMRATFFDMNPPLFGWELDYVNSGLTIEIRQMAERKFRPFGTFNSAANASMIFAMMMGLIWSGWWSVRDKMGWAGNLPTWLRLVLTPLILIAMFATYSRAGWAFLIGVSLAPRLFRYRAATIAFYVSSLTLLVGTVLASPYLLERKLLNYWTDQLGKLGGGDSWLQSVNIATMNSRLHGFTALVNDGSIWSPFGFRFKYINAQAMMDKVYAHDVFTLTLMRFGYVPLGLIGLVGIHLLRKANRYILNETDKLSKGLGSTCLALALVLVFGGTVNFAQFTTFPVNFWMWLMFACVLSLIMAKQSDKINNKTLKNI